MCAEGRQGAFNEPKMTGSGFDSRQVRYEIYHYVYILDPSMFNNQKIQQIVDGQVRNKTIQMKKQLLVFRPFYRAAPKCNVIQIQWLPNRITKK